MKNLKSIIGIALTMVLAWGGFTACQDDVDAPGMKVPTAKMVPNTKIADFKTDYWKSALNYYEKVGTRPDGSHIIVAGRVISSDASGNIYKNLVIQDETAALTLSINANSLYNEYRVGQEIVMDLTDMYVGKYSSLQQMGFPSFDPGYGQQTTFMPYEFFKEHSEMNGLPDASKVEEVVLTLSDLSTDQATLIRLQGQLVRFNNVHFAEGGNLAFCDGHQVNTNRELLNADGVKLLDVRTSGYANFWSAKLPEGNFDIVGILTTYGSDSSMSWQLAIRSLADILNEDNPTLPKGTETNPYDVLDVVDMIANDNITSGWMTGYIVGYVKPGISSVTSPDDIVWSAEPDADFGLVMNNNIVIGQTAEAHSLSDCVLLSLPSDTPIREYGNLADNPSNLGKQIWVLCTPYTYMDTNAVKVSTGAANEFRIEGVTVPGGGTGGGEGDVPAGDGTKESPYNPDQVVGFGTDANMPGKWTKGYIVGWINNATQNFADATNCIFSVPSTSATNVLLASSADETDYTKCIAVNLPSGSNARKAINLLDNPSNLGRLVSVYGNIIKYFAIPGMKEISDYEFFGEGTGGGETPGGSATYEETFAESMGDWFIHDVKLPSAATYIWKYNDSYHYMIASAYISGASYASDSWLVSPLIDLTAATDLTLTFDHVTNKFPNAENIVKFCTLWVSADGADWQQVTIPTYSGNNGWTFVASGNIDLSAYAGKKIKLGFRYLSEDGDSGSWEIKNVKITGNGTITATADTTFPGGASQGGGEQGGGEQGGGEQGGGEQGGGEQGGGEQPGEGLDVTAADLNTLNDGKATTGYGTYSTTDGWVETNGNVLSGGDADKNPVFTFIGDASVFAACLNGKNSTPGTLVSPLIAGGCKTLSFKYALPYADTKIGLSIVIKKDGAEVASTTISNDSANKSEVYTFEWTPNVTGSFTIEIVNTCPSNSSSNKDRVAIWNLTWTR